MRNWARRLKALLWLASVLIVLVGAGAGAFLWRIAGTVPDARSIAHYRPPEKSVILSSDGQVLAELYRENRQWTPLAAIPQRVRQATLAIEDHRFFQHRGVDPIGIARAAMANLTGGRVVQGGSTLTQQLARTLFLSPERTVRRKVREMILARRIEGVLSKEKILELYLNQVYYGAGAYGIRSAADVYFGKSLDELTVAEAALLAGLPSRPTQLSPFRNPKGARARRQVVLNRMADTGMIPREKAEAAGREPLRLAPSANAHRLKRAPYFVDWVERDLVARFGATRVYEGGLRVYTSLNLSMQRAAEEAVRQGLEQGRSRGRVEQAALVAIDPRTGQVKAMVGGRDYSRSQFNRALNRHGRQPGSAFKPFLYAAALEHGYTPETMLDDSPFSMEIDGKTWSPGNYDDEFRGPITLYEALIRSVNVPAIRVGIDVGPKVVAGYARSLGIRAKLNAVPSLAIGTSEVTPLEMAAAYAPFANGGKKVTPVAILRVASRDGTVKWAAPRPAPKQVLKPETARTMAMLLRDVVLYGTGRSASGVPNAAGKTGTTQDDRDAWFVGFTPELVTGVWAGNDDYSPMGGRVFGGNVPAPIWSRFMAFAAPRMSANRGQEIPSYRAVHTARMEEERRQEAKEQAPEEEQARAGEDFWSVLRRGAIAAAGLAAEVAREIRERADSAAGHEGQARESTPQDQAIQQADAERAGDGSMHPVGARRRE